MTLLDTGAIYAVLDARDDDHTLCESTLPTLLPPLVTTDAVVAELMHLLHTHLGWSGQSSLWRMIALGRLTIVPLSDDARSRMHYLMERYRDRPMDYADASLIAIAEEQGHTTVFSLDRDFYIYRLRNGKTLRVVP